MSPAAKESQNGLFKKRNKEVIRLWGGKILKTNTEENIGGKKIKRME